MNQMKTNTHLKLLYSIDLIVLILKFIIITYYGQPYGFQCILGTARVLASVINLMKILMEILELWLS